MHPRWRRSRRGVTPMIASVLLSGITVCAGVFLWSFRVNPPASGVQIEYIAEGNQREPAWGDPTDCSNQTIYANCDGIPAFFLVFTSHTPESILLTQLTFELRCNGTSMLNGTFKSLEVVPGTGSNPGSGSPALGKCGTWKPSSSGTTATYFNRLAYFQQINSGSLVLHDGDIFVVYEHPLANYCDRNHNCPDDDYHGAPPWCFTTVNACYIIVTFTGNPETSVATIPLMEIGTSGE